MIKTKTPRNWGGGIRQVSPPMLTSRLSNIGRWRTNGWKDYSRSRKIHERIKSIARRIHYLRKNFWFRCNTFVLYDKCRQSKCVNRRNDLSPFTSGRYIISYTAKFHQRKNTNSSLFYWDCSGRLQQLFQSNIGYILRLTPKGVA